MLSVIFQSGQILRSNYGGQKWSNLPRLSNKIRLPDYVERFRVEPMVKPLPYHLDLHLHLDLLPGSPAYGPLPYRAGPRPTSVL